MNELIELIKNDEEIIKGMPADVESIIAKNIELKEQNLVEIPKDFIDLLSIFNGISLEEAEIFAFNPDTEGFNNLLDINQHIVKEDGFNIIFLGKDAESYFIYDEESEEYQTIDMEELDVIDASQDFHEALEFFLSI